MAKYEEAMLSQQICSYESATKSTDYKAFALQRSPAMQNLASIIKDTKIVNSISSHFPEGSRENHTPVPNSYSLSYLDKKN